MSDERLEQLEQIVRTELKLISSRFDLIETQVKNLEERQYHKVQEGEERENGR